MGLMKWFKNLRKDAPDGSEEPSAPAQKTAPEQQMPPSRPAAPEPAKDKVGRGPETPVTPPPAKPPEPAEESEDAPSVEEIKGVLDTINTVFEEEDRENTIVVPGLALLKNVPESLRGENWDDKNYPDFELLLEREDVLKQLKLGRVAYPASTFAPMLPEGWLAVSDSTMLDLDLSLVVNAIPADQLQGASQKSDTYQAVEGMKSLFTPKRKPSGAIKKQAPAVEPEVEAVAPAPVEEPEPPPTPQPEPRPEPEPEAFVQPEPEPEPEPAAPQPEPVEPPAPKPAPAPTPSEPARQPAGAAADTGEEELPTAEREPVPSAAHIYEPDGWDGVEDASATGGVNVNTASLEDLEVLPGVGHSRAQDIISVREQIGGFKHIYQLAMVPGIGPKLFKQMTGLSLTSGHDRHEVLNKLLGMEPDAKSSLGHMCATLCERVGAVGCVLSTNDGVPLAHTPSVADAADRYAAISAQMFRKTGRYLRNLTGEDVDCLALPLGEPPVLVFAKGDFYFVIVQDERHQTSRDLKRANSILNEISWLLGKRAVVRGV